MSVKTSAELALVMSDAGVGSWAPERGAGKRPA
jgi:hypothetical protein